MFRAIISPIFRSIRLCVTACGIMYPRCCRALAWKRMHCLRFQVTGRQHRGCFIPQAVTHSLVLLKMGEIIARNLLSLLELLINRYCCIWLVVYIIYINDARSSKYHSTLYWRRSIRRIATLRNVLHSTILTSVTCPLNFRILLNTELLQRYINMWPYKF